MSAVRQPTIQPVRAPKTAEVVAATLRRQIVRGEIAEGEALPSEIELMQRFGVSRPSLREALRVLESENIIVVRRGARGGARASRPHISVAANYVGLIMQSRGVTLADVYEARIWIEPIAARILAEQPGRDKAVLELRRILQEELDALDDPQVYFARTILLHEALVDLSGNRTLALLWATLRQVLSSEILDSVGTSVSMASVELRQKYSKDLFTLIEEGKATEAQNLWRFALSEVRPRVVRRHGAKTVVDVMS
ncbi:FadR/GntR family transcriptional regulator [Jatrophihabitans sp. DSM 45814]